MKDKNKGATSELIIDYLMLLNVVESAENSEKILFLFDAHWLLHTDEQRSSEIQRRVLLIIGRAIIGIVGRLEPFSQVEFNTSVLQRIIK